MVWCRVWIEVLATLVMETSLVRTETGLGASTRTWQTALVSVQTGTQFGKAPWRDFSP